MPFTYKQLRKMREFIYKEEHMYIHIYICMSVARSRVFYVTHVATYAVFKYAAMIIKQKLYYAILTLSRAYSLLWRTFNKKYTYIIVPECVHPHIHLCFQIIEERIIFHCIRDVIDQKYLTDICYVCKMSLYTRH